MEIDIPTDDILADDDMFFMVRDSLIEIMKTKSKQELAELWNLLNCWGWPDYFPEYLAPYNTSEYNWEYNRINGDRPLMSLLNTHIRDWIDARNNSVYLRKKDWLLNHCNRDWSYFVNWWIKEGHKQELRFR